MDRPLIFTIHMLREKILLVNTSGHIYTFIAAILRDSPSLCLFLIYSGFVVYTLFKSKVLKYRMHLPFPPFMPFI
jgi:hypothetical protein